MSETSSDADVYLEESNAMGQVHQGNVRIVAMIIWKPQDMIECQLI